MIVQIDPLRVEQIIEAVEAFPAPPAGCRHAVYIGPWRKLGGMLPGHVPDRSADVRWVEVDADDVARLVARIRELENREVRT